MTQASLAPAEGVSSASYHPCQGSRTEIVFSTWVKHNQVFSPKAVPEDSWHVFCTCLNVVAFNICFDCDVDVCVCVCTCVLQVSSQDLPCMLLHIRREEHPHTVGGAGAGQG